MPDGQSCIGRVLSPLGRGPGPVPPHRGGGPGRVPTGPGHGTFRCRGRTGLPGPTDVYGPSPCTPPPVPPPRGGGRGGGGPAPPPWGPGPSRRVGSPPP